MRAKMMDTLSGGYPRIALASRLPPKSLNANLDLKWTMSALHSGSVRLSDALGDMFGIDGVPQAKSVGKQSCSQQDWLVSEHRQRPGPDAEINDDH